jgi:hypothetical protein
MEKWEAQAISKKEHEIKYKKLINMTKDEIKENYVDYAQYWFALEREAHLSVIGFYWK